MLKHKYVYFYNDKIKQQVPMSSESSDKYTSCLLTLAFMYSQKCWFNSKIFCSTWAITKRAVLHDMSYVIDYWQILLYTLLYTQQTKYI